MGTPATRAVAVADWVAAERDLLEVVEVVDGEFVIKRLGGNPHHYIARRLAQAFEEQWRGAIATAPGNWALQLGVDGQVVLGRVPDVLVDGRQVLTESVFAGVPDAVVEVWSPGNTLAEMNAKRREYRATGLPVLLEAFLTDEGDVHLEWLANEDGRWASVAVAAGFGRLAVTEPRRFTVVPNDLLHGPG